MTKRPTMPKPGCSVEEMAQYRYDLAVHLGYTPASMEYLIKKESELRNSIKINNRRSLTKSKDIRKTLSRNSGHPIVRGIK